MRVLWFTNTPSLASEEFGFKHRGGGWISSLEKVVTESGYFTLGICFTYEGIEFKVIELNGVTYYGIPIRAKNPLKRVVNRFFSVLTDEVNQSYFDNVLSNFKPDVIQVFGTENVYGKVLQGKFEKVVFHLQGLVAPYSEVYFPLGANKKTGLLIGGLKNYLQGNTFFHAYNLFVKKANREIEIIKNWKYFMGRTTWDKNTLTVVNPNNSYFHCDELLRDEFFKQIWVAPEINDTILLGTTINPNLYKGLDVIYKVLDLLKKNGRYKFKWKVFGITKESYVNNFVLKFLGSSFSNLDVELYGQLSEMQIIEELKSCHFFVHPSYIDNSPNSVCEAMLLGMPVVSSSVGGVKSLIEHGETGYLFNPYDKYDLAGLILSLIDNYEIVKQTGTKAREIAKERHSAETVLASIKEIYNQISND